MANSNKTTTIIGAFKYEENGKIIYNDMMQLFENFGNLKCIDFGPKKGGFNVLNVNDAYYEPGVFFYKYNKPWLEEAINRGDDIVCASDPRIDKLVFKKKTNGELDYNKRTGFGKEIEILEKNGYHYDPNTCKYIK